MYKLAQLAIHDPSKSLKTGEILIQPAQEGGSGDLLILIEIDFNAPAAHQFIQHFLEIAYGAYEKFKIHEPEKILENILESLNVQLPELAPKNLNFFEKLHCFIGILAGNAVYFSTFGKIKTYLIKPALLKDINGQARENDQKNIFDHLLSGRLALSDRLLITAESLTDYLSLEKIKKILGTLPPAGAIAHLTNILEAAAPQVSFFSIIIQMLSSAEPAERESLNRPVKASGSKSSLDQLLITQKETAKILTPPNIIEILKERLKNKLASPQKTRTTVPRTADKRRYRPADFPLIIIKKILSVLKTLWQLLSEKQRQNQLARTLADKITLVIKKFNNLSQLNKILAILLLALALLFFQNLTWQGQKLKNLQAEENYQNILTQIGEKQIAIETALIYNDLVRSQQLLKETQTLAGGLNQDSKEKIKKYQEVREQLQRLYEKVWKVVNVASPVSLINFREINLTAEVSGLGAKDDFLYGFTDGSQIFAVNTQTNATLALENFNFKAKNSGYFPKIKNLVILTTDNHFYTIKENEIQKLEAVLPADLKEISALTFYLDKMYLLDGQNKQIYRLTYFENDFRNPQKWLKEDLPLDQTLSLAADGYLYTLQSDNTVIKMGAGKKQDSIKITAEPALGQAAKIFTDEETANFYILDPQNKRFLVAAKEGNLINQYYSDQFNNLKDFIVREKEKKVYLLNGAQIFVVAIK
ncbi:MAG: hypothetical protein A2927_00015 [Candidatus Komeilibacteria bacterium RIFCSPLOWO2_01_FULL_45_10]|uniref:PPM-type phosphatase domain-containing protein n=1 Tax=Candidatus Komeilibacteria bacterium RIFCSPLOWO2_01_FULL_45_10 TaxID=1798550 RepID=A0A1G2BMC8_9BACT|nr:MAG: hypothetical protein A2927_00015 [Candidatus Komeilibacteria bacterium RIFCSPLOWO2_01_FULL_45_10]